MADDINPVKNQAIVSVFEALEVFFKRFKLFFLIVCSVTVLSIVLSLTLSPMYAGVAQVFASQQNQSSNLAALGGQFSQMGSSLLGGGFNVSEFILGLVKSRRVLDEVIHREKLLSVYDTDSLEKARNKLSAQIKTKFNMKSNIITISVEDGDKERSAKIANGLIEVLQQVHTQINAAQAAQSRKFYEDQLDKVKEQLSQAETELRQYQEKSGVIKVDDQVQASITSIMQIRSQIVQREVQLSALKTYATAKNSDRAMLESQIRELYAQMSRIENAQGSSSSPILSTNQVPKKGEEYIRKLRDLKYLEEVYRVLLQQYRTMQLEEAKGYSQLQVIDTAVVPETRIRPKRGQMVVAGFLLGTILGILSVFLVEFFQKTVPVYSEEIRRLKSQIPFVKKSH